VQKHFINRIAKIEKKLSCNMLKLIYFLTKLLFLNKSIWFK